MAQIKQKAAALLLTILTISLLLAAEEPKEFIQVFSEGNIAEETGFTFLTVSPLDEVVVGFPSGNVYLYDADDTFICGYKFPSMDALYQVSIDENGRIKYYVPRTDMLSVYDRSGKLLERTKLKNASERKKAGVEESNHVNSEGVIYTKKIRKIVKVYPNGNEVLFCELNDSFETMVEKVFTVIFTIILILHWGKNRVKANSVGSEKIMSKRECDHHVRKNPRHHPPAGTHRQ